MYTELIVSLRVSLNIFSLELYNNHALIYPGDKTTAIFFPLQVTIMATLQVSKEHLMANRTWKLKKLPNLHR